jgi:hypothetical protein
MKLFPQIRNAYLSFLRKLGKILDVPNNRERLILDQYEEGLLQEFILKGLIIPAKNPGAPLPPALPWPGPGNASSALEELRKEER